MTDQPPTGQQLDEIAAIAARATDDPFFVSDCEGSLQVWREKALTHVTRDEAGQIDGYSFPSTYKVTDQIIELDLSTWDPGEDATDDQQRQDICDLVESRAAVPVLVSKVRSLQAQLADAWVPCSPAWINANPGQCATAPRIPSLGDVSHLHPAVLGEDNVDQMAASLARDGFSPAEIANMLNPGVTPAEDLASADNPTHLRWGLGDVQWGDDDSVIVLLSGPDREAYWLELDPERAAALREDLAGPDGEPRRTLTPNEYDSAWHAVEGSAGEEGADPGTVLHAVLDRLGIEWQDAARPV